MNSRFSRLAIFLAAFLPALASTDGAVVAIDFGGTGQDVQTGYIGVSGTGSGNLPSPVFVVPSAALPGGETMRISSSTSLSFRDRGSFSAATYGASSVDLFEDYLRAGTATAANGSYSTMTIDIGGLPASTEHQVTLRIYDGMISATTAGAYAFEITGTGDANLANNSYGLNFHSNSPGLTPAEQAGYSETFLSNAQGNLQITITQTAGAESSIPMNSFDLVSIPEPASAGLAVAGAIALLGRRRRAA